MKIKRVSTKTESESTATQSIKKGLDKDRTQKRYKVFDEPSTFSSNGEKTSVNHKEKSDSDKMRQKSSKDLPSQQTPPPQSNPRKNKKDRKDGKERKSVENANETEKSKKNKNISAISGKTENTEKSEKAAKSEGKIEFSNKLEKTEKTDKTDRTDNKESSKNNSSNNDIQSAEPEQPIAVDMLPLAEPVKSALNASHPLTTSLQSTFFKLGLESSSRNLIAVAESGSGKSTSAVAVALHHLLSLDQSQRDIASILVVAPTRELVAQTEKNVSAMVKATGLKHFTLTTEEDLGKQRLNLERLKPSVVFGSIGRVSELIQMGSITPTNIRFLVLEDCDKLLGVTFEKETNSLIARARAKKAVYALSTIHSRKMKTLEKTLGPQTRSIILVSETKFSTMKSISHNYLFVPEKLKHVYLSYIINENPGKRIIVFANDNTTCIQLSIMLRSVKFISSPFTSNMKEAQRQRSLKKFIEGDTPVLIANDAVLRGLEIPKVEFVIHYDVPIRTHEYKSRCCRIEAFSDESIERKSVSIMSQYDLTVFQQIEEEVGCKMEEYPHDETNIKYLSNLLDEAWKLSQKKAKRPKDILANDEENADDAVVALGKKRKRTQEKVDTSKNKKQKR